MNDLSAGVEGRLTYLAENLASLHASPDIAWLAGRFEFLGEKAIGAALSMLALRDEAGAYRAARSASPRPAVARALWEELGIDALERNDAATAAFAIAEKQARPVTFSLADLFPGRTPGTAITELVVTPISFNSELMGVGLFLVEHSQTVEAIASILGSHAAVAIHQLRQREEARRLHSVDPRLWVPDEHYLLAELRREVSRARRYGRELGLVLLRLENENEIRARFGDFFTDHLMRRIGSQLLVTVRDSDVLGALAGAYAVIHTDTPLEGTQLSADRLRDVVEKMISQRFPEVPEPVVSVACVAFPATGGSVEELLDQLMPGRAASAIAA